jgi:hypothetical protein
MLSLECYVCKVQPVSNKKINCQIHTKSILVINHYSSNHFHYCILRNNWIQQTFGHFEI